MKNLAQMRYIYKSRRTFKKKLGTPLRILKKRAKSMMLRKLKALRDRMNLKTLKRL